MCDEGAILNNSGDNAYRKGGKFEWFVTIRCLIGMPAK